jgi:hypothetical protein
MRTNKLRIENLPSIKRVETELGETTVFLVAAQSDLHNDKSAKVSNA